ncbi:MAG: ABC transporter permease [Gemmatimonadota bacterium]
MTPPALTPRIWGILLRNEWFKARKRMAFLLPLGFILFVNVMAFGSEWYDARDDPDDSFGLPGAWSDIFSEDMSMFLLIFGSVCLIMLVSSEFSWRTARQNVIDGLSKSQWFVGKALLLPMVGILFISSSTLVSATIAGLGTDFANASGPVLPIGVASAAAGLLLAFMSAGGLALFISLAVRGAGGAMAVWFLWIFPMEQLIIPGILGRIEALQKYMQYLPFAAAQRLLGFENYDPAAFQRLVEAREAAERGVPPTPDLTGMLWVNAGWAALLLVAAFVVFRRRDL